MIFRSNLNSVYHFNLTFSIFLKALQKIRLADYIHHVANLLHLDAGQQLEVALLGSPASNLIDILAARLLPPTVSTILTVQTPHISTDTQMAPPPTSIPKLGLTSSPSTSSPSILKPAEPPTKHHCMFPTSSPLPATPPSPGPLVNPFLMVVVAELAIPLDVMPEQTNLPGGLKNYQCQLCTFTHTYRDCMLTHIQKHLNITISCPISRKGFQNATSLRKHSKRPMPPRYWSLRISESDLVIRFSISYRYAMLVVYMPHIRSVIIIVFL